MSCRRDLADAVQSIRATLAAGDVGQALRDLEDLDTRPALDRAVADLGTVEERLGQIADEVRDSPLSSDSWRDEVRGELAACHRLVHRARRAVAAAR